MISISKQCDLIELPRSSFYYRSLGEDEYNLQLMRLLDDHGRRDILEILEDRYYVRSTLVTSQLPVSHWHEVVGDPTLADAILDRLVHNAYKISLKGESMRKTTNP